MAITLTELVDSRTRTDDSAELHYMLAGTADDGDAHAAVQSGAPSTYDGLVRQSIQLEPQWVDTLADGGSGDGRWSATVRYGVKAPPAVGDSQFSFDTGGGTQHVTQSRGAISKTAPAGLVAPDFKGAIGVTHDNVEGVDIVVPVYHFAETHWKADAEVTGAYKAALFALTGKVNAGGFRGFAQGEVLFMGAGGSKRGVDDWEITFRFAASPNRTNIVVGDITVPEKKGWEYLWVRYEDTEDAAAKRIVKRPVAAYVEKLYDDGGFAGLGIGS